jgi:DNA (cytosine-5)-methyltransferase 1
VSALTRNGVGAGGGPDDNAAQAGHLVPTLAHALTSEGHDASEDGTGRGTPLTAQGASVRRLTPVECERLQGFPDGWTDITWRGRPAPDSRRYAALGDAVTVPVAEWIGRRLLAEHLRHRGPA